MSVNKYDSSTGTLTTVANGQRMWIGTQTAYDSAEAAGTLPSNCLIAITDDGAGTEQYSTDETDTGKVWIDDKPIYRKVVDFGALPSATIKTVAHNISNVDTWVLIKATAMTTSGTGIDLPFTDTTASTQSIACYVTATTVAVDTGSIDRSDYSSCYFILEYTKTTD